MEFLWPLKGFYAFEILCHAPNVRVRVRAEDGWIDERMDGPTLLSAPNGGRDSSHSFNDTSRANRIQGLK